MESESDPHYEEMEKLSHIGKYTHIIWIYINKSVIMQTQVAFPELSDESTELLLGMASPENIHLGRLSLVT